MPQTRHATSLILAAASFASVPPGTPLWGAEVGVKYITEEVARKNNIVTNSGFEEVDPKTDLPRAWHTKKRWAPGGDKEAIVVDGSTAASGRHSLRMKRVERSQYASSKGMPVKAGREYTLLCTAKQAGVPEGAGGGWSQMAWFADGFQPSSVSCFRYSSIAVAESTMILSSLAC